MLQYIVRRLLGLVPTLLIVGVLVFLLVHLLPGDPARLAAGPDANPETVQLVRKDLGLDRPLPQQFLRFVAGALTGDFGRSMRTKREVSTEIADRFAPTFWLTVCAMAWSVVFGMGVGVVSAVWRNRWPDRLGMTLAVSGISFPAFALGMVLMQVFAVQLNWLPTVGADTWKHYILPSLTLGAAVAAIMARFTRSSFVDILQEDFIRTARAKGLSEPIVVAKHALRNALIPVLTMMGLQFGFLLGGSIVVEVVFNWPGMGRLLVDAVDMRDYPVIQALVLLFSFEFILINLIVDVLYGLINPTIRPVGEVVAGPEGCLSFPEIYGDVCRTAEVEVRGINDRNESFEFKAGGLLARAIQHEVDHLNGVLFIDRMDSKNRSEVRDEVDTLQAATKKQLKRK